jgi:hypothetical protein
VKGLTGDEDENGDSIQVVQRGWLARMPAVSEATRAIGRLDPARTRMVLQMLFRLELLAQENTLLVTPSDLLIR